MNAQFQAMKRDVLVVEKTPEPASKAQGEGEVLRVLAENNFDAEKAVEESEKKGIIKEPTTSVAKLVEAKEKKEEAEERKARGEPDPAEVAAKEAVAKAAEEAATQAAGTPVAPGDVCIPVHPALKRIQSHRMKIATLDADPEKYVGHVERSYKDMGGVEIVEHTVVAGDTLAKLSLALFGTTRRWPELWILNVDDVNAFDHLYPGRKLKLPVVVREKHCEPATAAQN